MASSNNKVKIHLIVNSSNNRVKIQIDIPRFFFFFCDGSAAFKAIEILSAYDIRVGDKIHLIVNSYSAYSRVEMLCKNNVYSAYLSSNCGITSNPQTKECCVP